MKYFYSKVRRKDHPLTRLYHLLWLEHTLLGILQAGTSYGNK